MKKPIYNERIELNCSPKRALNKRATLFEKRALGQSRRTGRGVNFIKIVETSQE